MDPRTQHVASPRPSGKSLPGADRLVAFAISEAIRPDTWCFHCGRTFPERFFADHLCIPEPLYWRRGQLVRRPM